MAHDIMPGASGRDPKTQPEWQEAADAARLCLLLESGYFYGILTGPRVNSERCRWILVEARKHGVEAEDPLK
jgi:hypothetical protein